jgi:hypothetical protein
MSAGHGTWTELQVRQQAWSDLTDEAEHDSTLFAILILK